MNIQCRLSCNDFALAITLNVIFLFTIKRKKFFDFFMSYSPSFINIFVKQVSHAFLNLFHQMKFIVDSVNTFFAAPVHFADLQVSLVSFPANIISDFLLNTDSHIKPSHQLSLADIGYVIQILVFDLVSPHCLREQSKSDPLAQV